MSNETSAKCRCQYCGVDWVGQHTCVISPTWPSPPSLLPGLDVPAILSPLKEIIAQLHSENAALKNRVERLEGALLSGYAFFSHVMDGEEHFEDCDQETTEETQPPDENCTCQVGALAKMRAALTPEESK